MNGMDNYLNGGGRGPIDVSHAKLHARFSRGEHGAAGSSRASQTTATQPVAHDPAHQRAVDAAAEIFNTHPSTAHERSMDAARYLSNNGDSH